MRVIFGLSLLLTVAGSAWPQTADRSTSTHAQDLQTGYCPQTHQLEAEPSQKFFLDGTIGKRQVRMYLDRGGSGIVGLFFDTADWTITELGGTWNEGKIDASDETENHPATGHLNAAFAGEHLSGTWAPVNGDPPEPLELVSIPEPKCDGKEEWKLFHDPTTPVTFSYPASWHLEQGSEGIALTCPDPSEIAYSNDLWIKAGSGAPKGQTDLQQCGDKWVYPSECCNHLGDTNWNCHEAAPSRLGSASVLDVSAGEWRAYCHNGGYVGQTDGVAKVVLLTHSWLEITGTGRSSEIIDRLISTITEKRAKHPK